MQSTETLVLGSGVATGGGEGGSHQHTFCNHLKTCFKQKSRSKYVIKMRIFLDNCKIASASGLRPRTPLAGSSAPPPQTPAFFLPLTITTLSSSFLALKRVLFLSKRNKITTVNVLLLLASHALLH